MKNSRSTIFKRHQKILQALREEKDVHVEQLAEQLNISATTIRRDLAHFEKNGLISRFHGGAHLLSGSLKDELQTDEAPQLNQKQKQQLAKHAASLVEDNDTIFINSSSTALHMLDYLKDKQVTIVTNNGHAIAKEKGPRMDILLTGGELFSRKNSMVGEFALSSLSKITADKVFLGVGGINVTDGITTPILQETTVNEMMLRRCKGKRYILALPHKIGRTHNFVSGSISSVDEIITLTGGDAECIAALRERDITVTELTEE